MLSEETLALFWVMRKSCIREQSDRYMYYPASTPAGAQTQLFHLQAAQIIASCMPFFCIYIKTTCFFGRGILSFSNICLDAPDFVLPWV